MVEFSYCCLHICRQKCQLQPVQICNSVRLVTKKDRSITTFRASIGFLVETSFLLFHFLRVQAFDASENPNTFMVDDLSMRGERVLIVVLGILGIVGGSILVLGSGFSSCGVGQPPEYYLGALAVFIGVLLLILALILALIKKRPDQIDNSLIIGVVAIAVILILGLSVLWIEKPWVSSWEPEPSGQFISASRISATTISYRFGAFSPGASITNCKFILHVNDTYVGTFPVTGTGSAHSSTISNDSIGFTTTYFDEDNDERLSAGDYVTLTCSSSLVPMTDYTLFLLFHGSVVCEKTYST